MGRFNSLKDMLNHIVGEKLPNVATTIGSIVRYINKPVAKCIIWPDGSARVEFSDDTDIDFCFNQKTDQIAWFGAYIESQGKLIYFDYQGVPLYDSVSLTEILNELCKRS